MQTFRAALVVILLSSCASYTDETREVREKFVYRNYKGALETLDKSDLKEQDRNRLLYLLEKAMILDRLNKRDEARHLLIEADKLADKLFTTSISKEALTYIYNESAQDYPGEDYEKVAIHTILALSFIEDDRLKEANTEARKINTKLAEINNAYDKGKNRYSEDAFARYLSGIIYESQGQIDDAIIDYYKAYELYEDLYSKEFSTSTPDNLVAALLRLLEQRRRMDRLRAVSQKYKKIADQVDADKREQGDANRGEIVVLHEYGTIVEKTAWEFFIPFAGQVIRLSFPTIKKPSTSIYGENGFEIAELHKNVAADEAQDMNAIAAKTLEDRRSRLILKQGARLLAKGQLTSQAHKNFGPIGGIAANIYSAVSETADTRSWTLMPGAFLVSRYRVAPGKYTLTIRTRNKVTDVRTVDVRPKQMVLLRDAG